MGGSQSDGGTKWPTVNLINTSSVLRERVEDRARPRKCQGRNYSSPSVRNRVIEVDTPYPSSLRVPRTPGMCRAEYTSCPPLRCTFLRHNVVTFIAVAANVTLFVTVETRGGSRGV